jgi:hypothetical protein
MPRAVAVDPPQEFYRHVRDEWVERHPDYVAGMHRVWEAEEAYRELKWEDQPRAWAEKRRLARERTLQAQTDLERLRAELVDRYNRDCGT